MGLDLANCHAIIVDFHGSSVHIWLGNPKRVQQRALISDIFSILEAQSSLEVYINTTGRQTLQQEVFESMSLMHLVVENW